MSEYKSNTVFNFNRRAISSLAGGDHKGCATELELALKAFRTSLREASNTGLLMNNDNNSNTRPNLVSLHSVPLLESECALPASSQYGYNSLSLFCKAFVLVMENGDVNDETEALTIAGNERLVPAVILYNLGLSFHLDAVKRGCTMSMKRAYEFYLHSMTLLERHEMIMAEQLQQDQDQDQQGPLRTTGGGRQRALLAAIGTNMAHISASFFESDRTQSSMEFVRNIIDVAVTEGTLESLLDDDEIDIFSMNWIFYSECAHLTLAAAA